MGKVPEVTEWFSIVKVEAATLGETGRYCDDVDERGLSLGPIVLASFVAAVRLKLTLADITLLSEIAVDECGSIAIRSAD